MEFGCHESLAALEEVSELVPDGAPAPRDLPGDLRTIVLKDLLEEDVLEVGKWQISGDDGGNAEVFEGCDLGLWDVGVGKAKSLVRRWR